MDYTLEARFKAWGECLGKGTLTIQDHDRLYKAVQNAIRKGIDEKQVDFWIKQGREKHFYANAHKV